jgi:hypothetical protein
MKAAHISSACVVALALAAASCTMKNQDAPPLTGPSEFGTSVTVAVSPDVLALDGSSRSVVTVTARNANGQPLPNLSMRADMYVNGHIADFGELSAKSIVSGADGRATLVYTAPASNAGVESLIDIAITPIGTSAGNHASVSARIRLVPTGIRLPPLNLQPAFTFTPTAPAQGQTVLFDAQTSTGSISRYRWDFGDGHTAQTSAPTSCGSRSKTPPAAPVRSADRSPLVRRPHRRPTSRSRQRTRSRTTTCVSTPAPVSRRQDARS